jgi:hypothetical protein
MGSLITRELSAVVLVLLCAAPASTQTNPQQPHDFLQKHFRFSKEDLAAIDRGRIVTKLPTTGDKREVGALGVVRLNVSRELFLEKFMDIESFKKSDLVLQIRKFSSPASLDDLSQLTLEPEHVIGLKNCRVGNSNVKISAKWIERFHKINWSAPDHNARATALTQKLLLEYVLGYLKEGNSALIEYNDQPNPRRLEDEVRSLVEQSPHLLDTAPGFSKYLAEFPRVQAANVEDFIYWSKETVGGFKPVLGLTHVSVYKQKTGSPFQIIIASKQIYANHYFDGSLALTWIVDTKTAAGKSAIYLIYFNRSRMDALGGGLSWLKRYVARGRIREGLVKTLELTKANLEAQTDQP